jgi:MFS family permease
MQIVDHAPCNPPAYAQEWPAAIVVTALILAQFAAADGVTGIYAMLPSIYREFPAHPGAVSWVVSTFFLVAATMAAIAGRFADILGRRTVAIALLCCSTLGGILGSMAPTVGFLIAASVLIGMSTTLTPILIGLAREHLAPERLGFCIGAIAAAGCAGAGLVFLITGFIVDHFGRAGGYLSIAFLAFAAASFLTLGVPRPQRSRLQHKDIDFVRGVLFGPAIGGMILSIELEASKGWINGPAAVLFLGSLLLAAYWWRDQLRQARPLINLRLLSHGPALRGLAAMGLLGACLQNGQVFSLLLQQSNKAGAGFGMSATHAGFIMFCINGTAVIVAPLAGWLSKRHGAQPVAILGAGVMALSWVVCGFAFHTLGAIIPGAILAVTGVNLLTPPLYLLIVEATPKDLTSGAAGLGNALYNLGFAVGSQVILAILMGQSSGAQAASAANYRTAFMWLAVATATILPILVFRRGRTIANVRTQETRHA